MAKKCEADNALYSLLPRQGGLMELLYFYDVDDINDDDYSESENNNNNNYNNSNNYYYY